MCPAIEHADAEALTGSRGKGEVFKKREDFYRAFGVTWSSMREELLAKA